MNGWKLNGEEYEYYSRLRSALSTKYAKEAKKEEMDKYASKASREAKDILLMKPAQRFMWPVLVIIPHPFFG